MGTPKRRGTDPYHDRQGAARRSDPPSPDKLRDQSRDRIRTPTVRQG